MSFPRRHVESTWIPREFYQWGVTQSAALPHGARVRAQHVSTFWEKQKDQRQESIYSRITEIQAKRLQTLVGLPSSRAESLPIRQMSTCPDPANGVLATTWVLADVPGGVLAESKD